MNKASEDPQVSIDVSRDDMPSGGCMTASVRLTATIPGNAGEKITVGQARLCVPTNASQARQGFLLMDIYPDAPDMAEVTQMFCETVRALPECAGRDIVSPDNGMLAELSKAFSWIKEFSTNVFILSATSQSQVA